MTNRQIVSWLGWLLVAVVVAGCGPKQLTVKAAFTPTSRLSPTSMSWVKPGTKVAILLLEDKRQVKNQLGENKESGSIPVGEAPAGGVAVMVDATIRKEMAEMGLDIVEGAQAARVIKASLLKAWVEETNTYKGELRLAVEVLDENGQSLCNVLAAGTSTRFGRSFKAENYNETLSDSLLDALTRLLKNPQFRAAINGEEIPPA